MKKSILILLGLLTIYVNAQIIPANYLIYSNQIAAIMKNDGSMFTTGGGNNAKGSFQVPFKGTTSPSSIFNASLLISGKDNNENIFLVGDLYTPKYNPGPLGSLQKLSYEDMLNYNKIWSVYGQEIISHIEDYKKDGIINIKINNIYAWPAKGNPFFRNYNGFEIPDIDLAPFFDNDKNGIYNPDKGDYPKIESVTEESIPASIHWTIFHKNSNEDDNIKFEVGLTSWTFNCENSILNRTLFNNYKIINRSDKNLKDLLISLYIDPDLGCYTDDYLGCFESLNASYWYNSDNIDGEGTTDSCSYGVIPYKGNPPVQSLQFLNKNLYSYVIQEGFISPITISDFYYYFNGTPKGIPIINLKTGKSTKIMYTGLPSDTSNWSMLVEKGITEIDPRAYNSIFIKNLKSDEYESIDIAYTFHHHPDSNNIQNVNLAKKEINDVKDLYNINFKGTCLIEDCNEGCVWSGDTDNNGIVNYLDAVNIFRSVGEKGSKRNDFWEWQAHKSLPWNKSFSSGLNFKYADADGDGEIRDSSDLALLMHNEFKTHGIFSTPIDDCRYGSDFTFKSLRDSFLNTFVSFNLFLIPKKKNFQGISLELKIDSSYAHSNGLNSNFKIWKDNNISTYSYIKKYPSSGFNYLSQAVYFNKEKNNQLSIDTITWNFAVFKRPININFTRNYFDIEVCNALMYFEDGTIDTLGSSKFRLYLRLTDIDNEINSTEVNLFPNPTSDIVNIVSESPIKNIELLNLQSQVLNKVKCNTNNLELDISHLNSGIYIIDVKLKGGSVKRRIIKY